MSDDRDPLDVLAGEPMLGPRQAEVVDALVHRIANGPPMSNADREVSLWLRRTVGLVNANA